MVTEKDIINMGRKIKRSNNPKTLARYQAQIDAWIAELAQDQARTQADILTLEEKIKMEEEAREAENKREQDPDTGKFVPASVPKSPPGDSKKIAVKIAEQMIPLEEKIKMEEEARAAISPGINQYTMRSGAPESPDHKDSKKIAVKIAEQILPLEEKIKMEEEAREHQANPSHDPDTGKFVPVALPGIPTGEPTKKVAVKIAEKAGVSPRKCYSYHEFERLHLRRSS